MFKKIAIVLAVAVLGVLAYAATKPDTFRIERSATIDAPPEKVFAHVNDFHDWKNWSPFDKMDPAMKKTFGGAPAGKGSTYAWEGNGHAGSGDMTISESDANQKVVTQLHFTKPFEAHNVAEFTFAPDGKGTKVTWAMTGPTPYVSKLMTTFVSMDKMVGPMFEEGLANLKTLSEKG